MSKYTKGQSGNPAGRPPGSKSFQTNFAPLSRSMGRRVEVLRAPSELSDRVSKIEAKLALLQSDPTACDSHET